MTNGSLTAQAGQSVFKSVKSMWNAFPVMIGALLLISLANSIIPKNLYASVFHGNPAIDAIAGACIGSILAGNPITSYILGGELLIQGVSLLAVTAFIVSWVTVGLVQLPGESILLGKKFALIRNATAFAFSIIVAVVTVIIMGLI